MPGRPTSHFGWLEVANQAKTAASSALHRMSWVTHQARQIIHAHPVLSMTLLSFALFEMVEAAAAMPIVYEAEHLLRDSTGDVASKCHWRDSSLPQCDTYGIYGVIATAATKIQYLGQLYNQWAGSRALYDENSDCMTNPCYTDLEMSQIYGNCIQSVMVSVYLAVLNRGNAGPVFRNVTGLDCVVTIPDWRIPENDGHMSYRVLVAVLQIIAPSVNDNLCDTYETEMLAQANACQAQAQALATKDDNDPRKFLPLLALLGIIPVVAGMVIYYRRKQQAQSAIDVGTSTVTQETPETQTEMPPAGGVTQTAIVMVPPRPIVVTDMTARDAPAREIIFRQPPVRQALEERVVAEVSCCGFFPSESSQVIRREEVVTVERTVTIVSQIPEWQERPTLFIEPVGESELDEPMYHPQRLVRRR